MILFCTPESGRVLGGGGWTYLGTDPDRRGELERLLETSWTPLGSVVHEAAARLRRPFLDLVAGTPGLESADDDLFPLCCHLAAGARLAGEARALGLDHLTVVVENPRLFRQLKAALPRRPGLSFGAGPERDDATPEGPGVWLDGLPIGLLLERERPLLRTGARRVGLALYNGVRRLLGAVPAAAPGPSRQPSPWDVLVLLPADRRRAFHLLAALARAYPRGGRGFQFVIRPHPRCRIFSWELPLPARLDDSPLHSLLKACGSVVYAEGPDQQSYSRPALRYRPDALPDAEDVFYASPTAGDGDLSKRLEALRLTGDGPSPR